MPPGPSWIHRTGRGSGAGRGPPASSWTRVPPHEEASTMADRGKTNIVVMWTVGPDDVAEGDRIFESHAAWMTGHPRDGDAALISYKISKGPRLADPLDPGSAPTGDTIFVLNEI